MVDDGERLKILTQKMIYSSLQHIHLFLQLQVKTFEIVVAAGGVYGCISSYCVPPGNLIHGIIVDSICRCVRNIIIIINITKHRIALTKLRVSSHCLAIETGRYHKPTSLPVDQRLCAECGVLEDEAHFLCDCVRYSFLREDLFSAAIPYFPEFSMLTSREKFLFLLQTEYTCILKALGSFVYRAFKLHH